MRLIIFSGLLCLVLINPLAAQLVTGTVRAVGSGEALFGATIYHPATGSGTTTNEYGDFTFDMVGEAVLIISMLGYHSDTIKGAQNAGAMNVELQAAASALTTIEVAASGRRRDISVPNGLTRLSLQQVERQPVLLGEKDIFKALQLLPGVGNPREGFGGLYVRGGTPDQNLVLLDGAPVYNAEHLFGFLSVFNTDALKSVDLYRGGFPARFGGRVGSVLDVRMREGSRTKWQGSGGIGVLTSRLTLEGPVGKSKNIGVLISGRRTYLDLLFNLISGPAEKNILNFSDFNAKVNVRLGKRDHFYLSTYTGRDNYGSATTRNGKTNKDAFNWGNRTLTARWNHKVGERAFLNLTGIVSGFDFRVRNEETVRDTVYALAYQSRINDLGLKADLDWYFSRRHSARFGLAAYRHTFDLGTVARTTAEEADQVSGQKTNTTELAMYAEDEFTPGERWNVRYGLRFTTFRPDDGSEAFTSLEPRLNVGYRINSRTSLKLSYGYASQFLHLLSNSGPGLPTSLWVPATKDIAPQRGGQFALGINSVSHNDYWRYEANVYYRRTKQLIGYDNGATFLLLDVLNSPTGLDRLDILDNITDGDGRAYGFELAVNYQKNRLAVNFAYTLARAEQRLRGVDDFTYFPANHDRRHDLNINGSYELGSSLTLSWAWTFGSGVPITLPLGTYTSPDLPGTRSTLFELDVFASRNNSRMPAIHRLDLGLRWRRTPRWGEAFWEFGLYNAYARANPFFLEVRTNEAGERAVYQQAVFPAVPSISYSFKF
jgi:outer membrane receptor for ferrienterochelin and colicin